MVPAAFVTIDALPLTQNGKVDRRALPTPRRDAYADDAYEAPEGETEIMLAAIWQELLGVERIGRHDSFFALGGHSLLAVRLMSRIRAAFDVELPIRALFEAPDIARMAAVLCANAHAYSFGNLIQLRTRGTLPPLFCIHHGYGFSWNYVRLLPRLDARRPVYALQARGLEPGETLPQTMDEMVSDYIDQIQQIQPTGPYHLFGWSFGAVAAHALATRLQQQGHTVAFLGMVDGYPGVEFKRHGFETEQSLRDPDARRHQVLQELQTFGLRELGIVSKPQLESVIGVTFNNRRLMSEHGPKAFHGNILFGKAVVPENDHPLPSPDAWLPYVNGDIHVFPVNASHSEMLDPPHADVVGNAVNEYLDKVLLQ